MYRLGSSVLIAAIGGKTCPKTYLMNYLSAAKIKSDFLPVFSGQL